MPALENSFSRNQGKKTGTVRTIFQVVWLKREHMCNHGMYTWSARTLALLNPKSCWSYFLRTTTSVIHTREIVEYDDILGL
jgi:hypothetical protein